MYAVHFLSTKLEFLLMQHYITFESITVLNSRECLVIKVLVMHKWGLLTAIAMYYLLPFDDHILNLIYTQDKGLFNLKTPKVKKISLSPVISMNKAIPENLHNIQHIESKWPVSELCTRQSLPCFFKNGNLNSYMKGPGHVTIK